MSVNRNSNKFFTPNMSPNPVPHSQSRIGNDPFWAKIVPVLIIFAFFIYVCLPDGGDGWRVEKGVNDEGVKVLRINVSGKVATQNYSLAKEHGYIIVYNPQEIEVEFLLPFERTDGSVCYVRFVDLYLYKIGIDQRWCDFKDTMYLFISGKTAKEIINYIEKFR